MKESRCRHNITITTGREKRKEENQPRDNNMKESRCHNNTTTTRKGRMKVRAWPRDKIRRKSRFHSTTNTSWQ